MRQASMLITRAFKNLARQPGSAALSASTVAVVFLLLGMFLLVGTNLQRLAEGLQAGFRLSVYLREDCGEACRKQTGEALAAIAEVESWELITSEQALDRLRQRLGAEATVLGLLAENPLPVSFEVTPARQAREFASLQQLAQRLAALDGVEEVIYGQGWLERFFRFRDTLGLVGLVMGGLVLLAAMVIVANTIRLSVYTRRDEIEILRLIGASGWFIRFPFFLEGILLGLVGSAAGLGLLALVYLLLAPATRLPANLGQSGLELEFLQWRWQQILLAGGAALGLLGAMISLRRHLER